MLYLDRMHFAFGLVVQFSKEKFKGEEKCVSVYRVHLHVPDFWKQT